MTLIISLYVIGLLLTALVFFHIGKSNQKKKFETILKKGTGKFGIIRHSYLSTNFTIEVEELETAGKFTKVKVVDTIKPENCIYSKSELLGRSNFNEWVDKDQIIWYDNNSQRARDNKLTEILGK